MKISEKDAFSGLSFVKEIALVFKRRYSYMDVDDFVAAGGWKKAREFGKVRSEGRDYIMRDSDVVEFKIGS